jgi:hypothetical protein
MSVPPTDMPRGPLAALLRRWYLVLPLVVLGVLAGARSATAHGVSYTAEARLVVGSEELAAYEVPGYAAASEQLAANYSRYLGLQQQQGRLEVTLAGLSGVRSLVATPIPDSSVIRVAVAADDETTAERAADLVAKYLRDLVNRDGGGDTGQQLADYSRLSAAVGRARAAQQQASALLGRAVATGKDASVPAYSSRLAQAERDLAVASIQQTAVANRYYSITSTGTNQLRVLGPATPTGDDGRSREERYMVLGLVVGLALALAASLLIERRPRRAVNALGSPHRGMDI